MDFQKWEEELGMNILRAYLKMPVNVIKFNREYQRDIQPSRLAKISASMAKYGYWPGEIVYLNEKHEAIDGNHRTRAALENNIEKIPATIVTFPTKELEAKFFILKNNHNSTLSPVEDWWAKYLGGHPYATLLYRLEDDPLSLFYRFIAIKGRETRNSKLTVPKAVNMINASVLGTTHPWNRRIDNYLVRQANEWLKDGHYESARFLSNRFLEFYKMCFGDSPSTNPDAYRADAVRAICVFYKKLKEAGHMDTEQKIKRAANKMAGFDFTNEFRKTDLAGKIMWLVSFFNKGKKSKSSRLKLDEISEI